MDAPAAAASPRRRWSRYSLRAFLIFVTFVACAAAWIGAEIARHRQEEDAVAKLAGRNPGGSTTAVYASRFDDFSSAEINPLHPPQQGMQSGIAKKLRNLRSLWLEANGITSAGLVQLENLVCLEVVWLQNTAITDDGLTVLANFPELRDLDLSGTYVTDAAVAILVKSSGLKYLKLMNTNVTPNGIAMLQQSLPSCQIVR